MTPVFSAARAAVGCEPPQVDASYAFVRTLAQVVAQLALQLTALWGKEPGVGAPANFEVGVGGEGGACQL